MATLSFRLHAKQQNIQQSPARFKVVTAGRRSGKTYFAAVMLILEGLKNRSPSGFSLENSPVWYVAPTFGQGKDAIWKTLKSLARPIAKQIKEKDLTIVLPNNREITLKGSDNEESLRGPSLGYLVLDEFATMKPKVFEEILSPALSDMEADCLFIGTPKGKNHFYDMWMYGDSGNDPEWASFHFCSIDNPMINPKEIASAKRRLSREAFEQEYEASFKTGGGKIFKFDEFKIVDKLPPNLQGSIYITVDPAGFKEVSGLNESQIKRLDETAIAVVHVSSEGWHVLDLLHGRWGVRETSLQIIRAAQRYNPAGVGIEGGALKNAVLPYMEDQMRRMNIYPDIVELRHGGQRKIDRIVWSLQGRFQHGRIKFVKGDWNKDLIDQLLDFPDPLTHDDLADALAYVDQISSVVYATDEWETEDFEPLDEIAGY